MNKTSILHISDLHRSKGGEITNAALLTSLLNDKDNYITESPRIKAPDFIVVSGDIIRGATNDPSGQEVRKQYEEALEFLNELVKHFLDGDKKRIIIIPGNHDIDWAPSKQSMVKVNPELYADNTSVRKGYLKKAINEHSSFRWSWEDLAFYEIKDQALYNKRLEAFSEFYESFYEGERVYSLNPQQQFALFDLPEFDITVLALSSCYSNDHLKTMGDIHPDCLATPSQALKDFKKKGRLLLATWHHNTKGLPYAYDYMDSSKMKNLIDCGISLGFHGHQHKTEVVNEFNNVFDQKKIVVFSAGTLCAGPAELPTGHNRQYNIIEIEMGVGNSGKTKVTLHTREKTSSSSFENPIWTAGRIDSTNNSHFTTEIETPAKLMITEQLLEAESRIKLKDYKPAIDILIKLDLSDVFVRKYLLDAVVAINDYDSIYNLFKEPINNEEAAHLLSASLEINNKEKMKAVMEIPFIKDNKDQAILALKQKLDIKLR